MTEENVAGVILKEKLIVDSKLPGSLVEIENT